MLLSSMLFVISVNIIFTMLLPFSSCHLLNLGPAPVVTVEQGKMKGMVNYLGDGTKYYSFTGIPFAKPPLGDLRFKAPLPPEPWDDVYDATKNTPVCIQEFLFDIGSEDCLYLNIFTRSLQPNAKLPVIIFIFGGGFRAGSPARAIFGPEFFLQHNVILVTINYRLEVLGFLNLDTPEIPGNAGLKDQVAALRYVKNNIAKFGGDPDNITIQGQSVGAASVTYHMISPMSRGLFNKAIAESGTCLADFGLDRYNSTDKAFELAKILRKETKNVSELTIFFQNVRAPALAGISDKVKTEEERNRIGLGLQFLPVIEKNFRGVESFLTEDPLVTLAANNTYKVPILIGYNSIEDVYRLEKVKTKFEVWNKNKEFLVPSQISNMVSDQKAQELGKQIQFFYLGDSNFSKDNLNASLKLTSNIIFMFNVIRFMDLYAMSNQPIYAYCFNYDTDLNLAKILFGISGYKGASHGDEIFYLFNNLLNYFQYNTQKHLRQIVYNVTKMWTQFATSGNPTPENSTGVIWKPYTPGAKEYLHLADPPRMEQSLGKDWYKFWRQLYRDAGVPTKYLVE